MTTALARLDNFGLDPLKMIETNPKLQPSTKAQYKKVMSNYLATGNSLADSEALAGYALGLNQSSRAFLKAAVKMWTQRVESTFKAQATPENVTAIQASIYRLESLNEAIEIKAQKGQKAHSWLTQAEVKKLLATCDDTLKGQRDKLILGLLVGAGLRREELAGLKFEHVKLQPVKGKMRTVLEITGKGAKTRIVPIKDSLANAIDQCSKAMSSNTGFVVRSMNNGAIGDSITSAAVFNVVREAGAAIGKPGLAPHDLRRTYAQLGYEAGIVITQISKLLGHSNVATTQRYLNLDLDLETTISDFIPFE